MVNLRFPIKTASILTLVVNLMALITNVLASWIIELRNLPTVLLLFVAFGLNLSLVAYNVNSSSEDESGTNPKLRRHALVYVAVSIIAMITYGASSFVYSFLLPENILGVLLPLITLLGMGIYLSYVNFQSLE